MVLYLEDTEPIWNLFRHLFPELTRNHIRLYRHLWQIEPLSSEQLIKVCGLSRATIFRLLNDLLKAGLIHKNHQSPVSYYAANPLTVYSDQLDCIASKLKKGKEMIHKIVESSSSLSEELYLIQLDGGQKRLMSKKTRQTILDEFALREIRRSIDAQIKEAEQSKLKPWMLANRAPIET